MEIGRAITALSDEFFDTVVRLRRDFHAHPELSFDEHGTARKVAELLRELGFEVAEGIAGTGVIAHLDGSHDGPCIALRADMDALPITEENEFSFASRNPGVMHACGHDAHMACLLGAAMILARLRKDIRGGVRFLFQPAEERAPGGAQQMIAEGALAARGTWPVVDAVLGQHVLPTLPAGTIGVRPGAFMASTDELHIEIRGEGGHAAAPHTLLADAVYVAAQVVVALQSVVSRHCPPDIPSVLTIGRVEADGATNVIPPVVRLQGTFRSMDDDWRYEAHAIIRRIVEHTVAAHGGETDCRIEIGYPPLLNDSELTGWVRRQSTALLGPDRVRDLDLWFAAEDFAFYARERPACFYILGVGNEAAGILHGLHTPRFTIDEEALRTGAATMAHLAMQFCLDPSAVDGSAKG